MSTKMINNRKSPKAKADESLIRWHGNESVYTLNGDLVTQSVLITAFMLKHTAHWGVYVIYSMISV